MNLNYTCFTFYDFRREMRMEISNDDMKKFAALVAEAVIEALEKQKLPPESVVSANPKLEKIEKTAYQKTETLLYNYNGFRKIINDKYLEISTLRENGIPKKSNSISTWCGTSYPKGIVREEDAVESAVHKVLCSISDTVEAIDMIDAGMKLLENDPYYPILPLRYFEGMSQEDIAAKLGCSQVSISKNKNRLIRELSMKLFPNQTINEMLA